MATWADIKKQLDEHGVTTALVHDAMERFYADVHLTGPMPVGAEVMRMAVLAAIKRALPSHEIAEAWTFAAAQAQKQTPKPTLSLSCTPQLGWVRRTVAVRELLDLTSEHHLDGKLTITLEMKPDGEAVVVIEEAL